MESCTAQTLMILCNCDHTRVAHQQNQANLFMINYDRLQKHLIPNSSSNILNALQMENILCATSPIALTGSSYVSPLFSLILEKEQIKFV